LAKSWNKREIFTIFFILSGASGPNMFGCDYLLYTKGYNFRYIYIIQKIIQKVMQKVWPVACLIFIKFPLTLKHHWEPISLCKLCSVRRSSRMWGTQVEQTKLCTLPMSYNYSLHALLSSKHAAPNLYESNWQWQCPPRFKNCL